jgi:C1A family cysteine protease
MKNFKFVSGWRRDKPDPRDFRCKLSLRPGIDSKNIDLRTTAWMPPVWDQGELGSCTAQGIGGAYEFTRKKQNLEDFTPSTLFIYYNERALEGNINEDAGAEPRDGMKVLQQWGCCNEGLWPYIQRKFANKPSSKAYGEATKNKIKTYERVEFNPDAIRAALSHQSPVVFGIQVFSNFMDTKADGIVPSPSGDVLGGHCMLIVGSKDDKFIFRNSWGERFGEKGYGYIDASYVTNENLAGDMWVVGIA